MEKPGLLLALPRGLYFSAGCAGAVEHTAGIQTGVQTRYRYTELCAQGGPLIELSTETVSTEYLCFFSTVVCLKLQQYMQLF